MSAVSIDEAAWSRALPIFTATRAATLICHVSPDGDALGSMLGLARVLRARGVDVTCTWGDEPFRTPSSYSWLPGVDQVTAPADVDLAPPLLVVLDTGSVDRLGVLAQLADAAGQVVVIDHHANNAGPIEGVLLVDPAAAATAAVVAELIRRLDIDLDVETATCLYTGLVTDTGGFSFAATTAGVHELAARLLRAGVRPDDVNRRLWSTAPFGYVGMLSAALARSRLDADAVAGRGLVWTTVLQDDLRAAGLDLEDADAVMGTLRRTAEADVAVLVKEAEDGTFRVSTRSRGATDVGAACGALGGGGHRLAAGFTSRTDPDTTIETLRLLLDAQRA